MRFRRAERVWKFTTELSGQIARYLDLATAETKLTAANMANVDTPATARWGWTSRPRCGGPFTMSNRDGRRARRGSRRWMADLAADGNNVSIDRESLNLAEAQLKFRTGVALLKQEYQRIMDAIHADK